MSGHAARARPAAPVSTPSRKMKVLFIGNGLTHYYNLVLSRLNNEPGIELVVVAPVVLAMKAIRGRLIIKSIPFRYTTYADAARRIAESPAYFASLPRAANVILQKLRLARAAKRGVLSLSKRLLNLPDAHVNYVEAFEYWDGYGVPRNKIFITRNSPDTDLLFASRAAIEGKPPILPHNPHRFLHVGRLVEWKRVDMLLRALARTRERFPDAELLVIGT